MLCQKKYTPEPRDHADVAIRFFKDRTVQIEYSMDGETWHLWTQNINPPFLNYWFYRIKE